MLFLLIHWNYYPRRTKWKRRKNSDSIQWARFCHFSFVLSMQSILFACKNIRFFLECKKLATSNHYQLQMWSNPRTQQRWKSQVRVSVCVRERVLFADAFRVFFTRTVHRIKRHFSVLLAFPFALGILLSIPNTRKAQWKNWKKMSV